MTSRWPSSNKQNGFTIPELLVVMVMTVMFSGLIMYFTIEYWRSLSSLQNDSETYVSRLTASDLLRNSLNESNGLIIQNSLADANTHVPDPANVGNDYWLPIHAVPKSIANGNDGSYAPVIYYRRPSIDASKNVIFNGPQPYEDQYILYLGGTGKKLYLRTIANPDAPANDRKTSCPSSLSNASCPADRLIAENVSSIDMRYFSRSGNPIDYQSITDPLSGDYIGPDYPAVEVVELNIHFFKKATIKGGKDTISQTVIRVALRNS